MAGAWVMQSGVKQHPFSLQWQRAVYSGLTALIQVSKNAMS